MTENISGSLSVPFEEMTLSLFDRVETVQPLLWCASA
jgi:hypothetical protein